MKIIVIFFITILLSKECMAEMQFSSSGQLELGEYTEEEKKTERQSSNEYEFTGERLYNHTQLSTWKNKKTGDIIEIVGLRTPSNIMITDDITRISGDVERLKKDMDGLKVK